MLIDHITELFVPKDFGFLFHLTLGNYERDITLYVLGRVIGRIAFPLFAFLIVQGFLHTSNLKRYMLRLGIFALLSEIPFDFAFWGFPNTTFLFYRQNIFFTLLLGLIAIALLDQIHKNYQGQPLFMNVLMIVVILAACFTLITIRGSYLDYGYGILVIVAFYFGRQSRNVSVLLFILITGFLFGDIQLMAILAAPFIYLYNGEKGPSFKYAFYAFYPVHLVILRLISLSLVG